MENFDEFDEAIRQNFTSQKIISDSLNGASMHAIVKILPVNYITKGNSSKFSIANNLRYTVALAVAQH